MKLTVLLSTFNGERYLREQLDSLLSQTVRATEIFVRDDGSTDGTVSILKDYAQRDALHWCEGENIGPGRSFWRLLSACGEADYCAFCDQDDVWDEDKLETAVDALKRLNPELPALYCSDVRVTDEKRNLLAQHMIRACTPDYPHALIRNLAPGCTFVLNRSALDLLRHYDAEAQGIELHDWTAYQIISCFGTVVLDQKPHMDYRQHANNAVGASKAALSAYGEKAYSFLFGRMKNSRQRQALRLECAFNNRMSMENRELTALMAHYMDNRKMKQALIRLLKERTGGAEGDFAGLLALINRL